MIKVVSPRWTHKCPCCKRKIFWEKIYCVVCIKAVPDRGRFTLSKRQRWLNSMRMPGVNKTSNHLLVSTLDCTICAECGQKLNGHSLKHQCFFRSDTSLRLKDKLTCSLCKKRKLKLMYPLVRRGTLLVRTSVCAECLDGSKLVLVTKRKYEKRIVV